MPAALCCAAGLALAVTAGTTPAATPEMSIALMAIATLRPVLDMAVSPFSQHFFSPPSAFIYLARQPLAADCYPAN
jgi:hypothetical protein